MKRPVQDTSTTCNQSWPNVWSVF